MTLFSDVQAYIDNAAAQYNVSPQFLSTLAQFESGGNVTAQSNTSSASGLFQITKGTAAQYGVTNVFDPQQSANAAAAFVKDNYNALSSALGTAPTDWQQYLAYQQGAGGALALLRADPNANAIQALQSAGLSSTQAYNSIVNNVGSDFSGNASQATVGDFLGYIQNKWGSVAAGSSTSGGVSGGVAQGVVSSGGTSSSGGVLSWLASQGTRVAIVVVGVVFIGGALVIFARARNG